MREDSGEGEQVNSLYDQTMCLCQLGCGLTSASSRHAPLALLAPRAADAQIVRVPYQRIQAEKDHVQPDNAQAILMVNNAVNGGVPWVRLNDEAPNQTYDPANPPAMLPESMDRRKTC